MAPPIPKPPPGAVLGFLKIAIANAYSIPVLVRLGVFDALDERRRIDELAARTGTNAAALARVLSFSKCAGLVSCDNAGWFQLTDSGRMLVRDHDETFVGDAAVRGARRYRERWEELESILRGGARQSATELDLDALDRARVSASHRTVLTDYAAAFSRSQTYVDVESGDPSLLAAVLKKSGRSEGIFIGRAADLERAKPVLSEAGVAPRCELLLPEETLPPGDAYLVSHRLERLSDDDAVALLSRVRRAMKPTSRVLVIGQPVSNQFEQVDIEGAAADLEMLLLTPGGKLRRPEEIHALCTRASLAAKPVTFVGTTRTTDGEMHRVQLIEATAAPLAA